MEKVKKIYGPYLCSDGRNRIVLIFESSRTSMSYARFLMMKHLNRMLRKDEEVHHINECPWDDRIENYEIVHSTDHRLKHNPIQVDLFSCFLCDKLFELSGKRLKNFKANQKRRMSPGPFCSKSCAGKYNAGMAKWYTQKT